MYIVKLSSGKTYHAYKVKPPFTAMVGLVMLVEKKTCMLENFCCWLKTMMKVPLKCFLPYTVKVETDFTICI